MSELIDTGQIAELLNVTREHVTDKLTKAPGFPAPAVDLSRRMRRWDREEVMGWKAKRAGVTTYPLMIRPPDKAQIRKKLVEKLAGAQRRSRRKGQRCALSVGTLVALHEKQFGRCALSKRLLELDDGPFSVTIDRIDSSLGYEPNNVRLVCLSVNLMMNRWGDSVFRSLAA